MNTKDLTKEQIKLRSDIYYHYAKLFQNLFHNSIVVENLPKDLPKRYILDELYMHGAIAYDYKNKLYLPFALTGVDKYGLPTKCTLIPYISGSFTRKIEEVCILRINDTMTSIYNMLDINIKKIVELDIAIMQNIESSKITTLVGTDNKTMLSMTNIMNARRMGNAIVFVDSKSMNNQIDNIKTIPINAPYLVDRYLEDKEKIVNECFTMLGISSANIEKRERVQGIEILASQNLAIDCINMAIDTFNYDAKIGRLDIRIKANTNLIKESEIENQIKLNNIGE